MVEHGAARIFENNNIRPGFWGRYYFRVINGKPDIKSVGTQATSGRASGGDPQISRHPCNRPDPIHPFDLRELAKGQNGDVRTATVKALASFAQTEDLSLLCELALAPGDNVAAETVRGLASSVSQKNSKRF